MARIAGINIPQNKVVSIALTYIHGIGLHSSKKICKELNIPTSKRVNELSEEQVLKIREFIEQTYDGDLKYAQPTAHLMSEMLTGNIPLPDMNEVFRILGTFRNTLYSMTGLNKLGPKRIDLPQLLALDGRVDDITDLAKIPFLKAYLKLITSGFANISSHLNYNMQLMLLQLSFIQPLCYT